MKRSSKTRLKRKVSRPEKGFFYAILPKDGKRKKGGWNVVEIRINTKKIQPIESW